MAYIQSSSRSLQPPLTMLINLTANIILILAIAGSMVVLTAGLLVHGFEVRPQSQHRPLSWSLHFDKPRYSFGSGTGTGTCTGTRTAESAKYPVYDEHQTRVRTCCFQNRLGRGRGLFMAAQVDPNDSIPLDNHNRDDGDDQILDRSHDRVVAGTKIVLWRGEGTKGYSLQFRHLELNSAYMAMMESKNMIGDPTLTTTHRKGSNSVSLAFTDATPTVDEDDDFYGAMQYVNMDLNGRRYGNSNTNVDMDVDVDAFVHAAKRSSLVREIYSVISTGQTYEDLAVGAIRSDDPILTELRSNEDSDLSWCVRLREYGLGTSASGPSKRSSNNREQEAIADMKPFLQKLHGKVNLKNADCALYIFEGELNHVDKVLVRKVASGASTQIIAPNTRHCVTRTPLCPLASFIMCNLGRVKDGDRVLDPYSGSCSTLLACAMVADCQTVGIEIAGNSIVNRDAIIVDFESRGLKAPASLIQGDCTNPACRDIARSAVDGQPFDVILADPPYGLREKASKHSEPPLVELVESIRQDYADGKPLLRAGGKLVVFVPMSEHDNLNDNLPSISLLDSAKLRLLSMTEQPLSDTLSRWLVVYEHEA